MSRISRGVFQIERKRVDLVEVVRAEITDYRTDPKAAVVPLFDQLPQAPIWIDGDPVRLSQIVQNLLQNAYKFTAADGRVEVCVHQEGREAVVAISDTGMGIPQEGLASIFEPFVQLDQRLERATSGLGLGLAIVKRLASLHGGSVEVRSGGPGQGAEFTVRLPLAGH